MADNPRVDEGNGVCGVRSVFEGGAITRRRISETVRNAQRKGFAIPLHRYVTHKKRRLV